MAAFVHNPLRISNDHKNFAQTRGEEKKQAKHQVIVDVVARNFSNNRGRDTVVEMGIRPDNMDNRYMDALSHSMEHNSPPDHLALSAGKEIRQH